MNRKFDQSKVMTVGSIMGGTVLRREGRENVMACFLIMPSETGDPVLGARSVSLKLKYSRDYKS